MKVRRFKEPEHGTHESGKIIRFSLVFCRTVSVIMKLNSFQSVGPDFNSVI